MSHFFAFLKRMRFIQRWGLMRNTVPENIAEHSLEVAFIAHQLAILRNVYFGGTVDANKVAVLAMYHETSEIFTGDMPTPIKYFDATMRQIYGQIEVLAQQKMVNTLPEKLRAYYETYIINPEKNEEWELVKAADNISAYMKCCVEVAAGNNEFREARLTIQKKLEEHKIPEVEKFLELYIPSLNLSLDEMQYSQLEE